MPKLLELLVRWHAMRSEHSASAVRPGLTATWASPCILLTCHGALYPCNDTVEHTAKHSLIITRLLHESLLALQLCLLREMSSSGGGVQRADARLLTQTAVHVAGALR